MYSAFVALNQTNVFPTIFQTLALLRFQHFLVECHRQMKTTLISFRAHITANCMDQFYYVKHLQKCAKTFAY